ncbi:PadR family transcriptional regulator [Rothia sp. ZJ932]|uniref:PadR family transcriptional regulator n=1 Tax=Rothia sp. ZJ932 TaxID=2810516 RepID=UPI0019689B6B|nr:PadR family transcriptional regulator [Rothia sp. ZJ932]QRZ60893.1 helix-turn-helix transcriptional regulator [Rothia sp. ZJ932]
MKQLSRITPATADVLEYLLGASAPVWGLLIIKETGRPAGSIYPILERLENAGWAVSQWDAETDRGPRRRLYSLTAEGAAAAPAALARNRARQEIKGVRPVTRFAS